VNEPRFGGRELDYVRDCLERGWISGAGDYIERFESRWAAYCGVRHGIAVSSGTAALQVAIDALGLAPGDEVILPAFTIISCALAIVRAGATPVAVDCDPATYCIDPAAARAAVTTRTRAVMAVHMYGHPADMAAIRDLAREKSLALIEDAAQAHGAECRSSDGAWERCGGMGTIAIFSFYANKPITTGEGGMVMTGDDALAQASRKLRNLFPGSERFVHEKAGYNFRLTNLQAAVGLAQCERIEAILERKRAIGARYDAALAAAPGLVLRRPRENTRPNHCMYPVLLDDRVGFGGAEFARRLAARGVETRPFFVGMHEQPALRARGLFEGVRLPVTERISRRGLYLPAGVAIRDADVDRVAEAVIDLLRDA